MEEWHFLAGASVAGLVGYFIGQAKNKPIGGAVAGFFLGPIGWLLMALSRNEHPRCPWCREVIAKGARKCRSCRETIPRCPECDKQLGTKPAQECKHCGAELAGDEWN